MAQFEALNSTIEELSGSVDNLIERLEAATVEDPAVQAAIDEAVAKIKEVQGRIDGIAGDPNAPRVDNTLPGDLPS